MIAEGGASMQARAFSDGKSMGKNGEKMAMVRLSLMPAVERAFGEPPTSDVVLSWGPTQQG